MANSFNEVTAVLTTLSRVWGLRNFTRPENKVRFFFGWLYNIFVLSLSITIVMCVELAQFNQLDYETEGVIYKYLIIVYFIGLPSTLILGWYHSKDLLRYKNLIYKVEEDIEALGLTRNNRRAFLQFVLFSSLWFCATMIVCALYVKWLKDKPLLYVVLCLYSYWYGKIVWSILLLDFLTNVFWIGIKFRETNELLNGVLLEYNRKDVETISESIKNSRDEVPYSRSKIFPGNYSFNSTFRPRSTKTIFRQIRFVHQQLCCITKILNKIFDSQLLITSANTVLYVTIVCYYLCIEIRKTMSIKKLEINLLTIFITDAIFDFAKLCIVTRDCEYVMKQANRTTAIVHEFALCQADTELKEEILQFSLQISHARQGRSRINFFSLNYDFLRGCVVFVTTYLIIIIQFSKSPEFTQQDSVTTPTTTETYT